MTTEDLKLNALLDETYMFLRKADDPQAYSFTDLLRAIQILGEVKKWNQPIWKCKHYNPKANEIGERGCASLYCRYAGWQDVKELQRDLLENYISDNLTVGDNTERYLTSLFTE